uniref:Uncharacterized protein n=1 Tax=viral metagenome TaxID=1070528 RepID=A0A6M3IFD8_9ZZZZ
MAEKKIYAGGTVGPLLYDDTDLVDDPDGDFAGVNFHASVTDGQHYIGAAPTLDQHVVRKIDITSTFAFFQNTIFPDPSASDQGATDATYDTVKDLIDAMGSTEKATLVFRHSGVGNTTVYRFSTAEVITSNISIFIEPGAAITVNGVILTINGPFVCPIVKCFYYESGGSVVFGIGAIDWCYSEWFGAMAETAISGTADDVQIEAAINAAQNTKKVKLLSGYYEVTDEISISYTEMVIQGSGRNNTILYVADGTGFTGGVFNLISGEPSTTIEDLQILFYQPSTAVKGNLTAHKPAIYAYAQPRARFRRLKIVKAYDGIDLTGNSGGVVIEDLEMSCFNIGIDIDGSLDEVYIDKFRLWPFGLDSSQDDIFFSSDTTGIRIKRMDGLSISNSMFICGAAINFASGGSGGDSFTRIVNTNFDTNAEISVDSDHSVIFSNCWFSKAVNGMSALDIGDGIVQIENSRFFVSSANQSVIRVNWSDADYENILSVSNCTFNTSNVDVSSIEVTATTLGYVYISNNHFHRTLDTTYSEETIDINSNIRGSISGNSTRDKGTGTGTFIAVLGDNYLNIIGNAAVGWTVSLPSYTSSLLEKHNTWSVISFNVASASTITLPDIGELFVITGNTTINTINYGRAGRIIILTGSVSNPVLNDNSVAGGNLKLAGDTNFTLGDDDMIMLVSLSSANWFEISRSTN